MRTHAEIARRLHRSRSMLHDAARDLIREAALNGGADDLRRAVDAAACAAGRDRESLLVLAGCHDRRFSSARAARVRAAMNEAGLLPVRAADGRGVVPPEGVDADANRGGTP